MARIIADIPTPYTPEQVNLILTRFFQQEGYIADLYLNEPIMGKGDGFLMAKQYVKAHHVPGTVHLEAWMMGSFGGENAYTGFVGIVVKIAAKKKIQELIDTVNGTSQRYFVPLMQ